MPKISALPISHKHVKEEDKPIKQGLKENQTESTLIQTNKFSYPPPLTYAYRLLKYTTSIHKTCVFSINKFHQTGGEKEKPSVASMAALSIATIIPTSEKITPAALFKPLPARFSTKPIAGSRGKSNARLTLKASMTEKIATGVTAGVVTAAMMVPHVAEAATGGSPSLQNFLYSIIAGGVVLTAILGAVIGVSNFDPVKRT